MDSYFLDSSGVVKRYVPEVGSAWVRAITARGSGNDLILARVTEVEVVSALVRHLPALAPADLALAISAFGVDCRQRGFRFIAISRALTARAAWLAVAHRLRGYDAIQLAAALEARSRNVARGLAAPVLVSADQQLNVAARVEGFSVDDPNTHP